MNRRQRRAAGERSTKGPKKPAIELPEGCTVIGPGHEHSAWLRGRIAVAKRVFAESETIGAGFVAVVALGDRWAEPGSPEDRTCDRCGVYVPGGDDDAFHVIVIEMPDRFFISGGLCRACHKLEGVS